MWPRLSWLHNALDIPWVNIHCCHIYPGLKFWYISEYKFTFWRHYWLNVLSLPSIAVSILHAFDFPFFRWKQEFKSPDDCLKKKLSVIETRLIYLVFNVFLRVNDDQMRPLLQSSKCKKNIYTVDQFCDWKGKPQRRTCRRRYSFELPVIKLSYLLRKCLYQLKYSHVGQSGQY